MIPFAHPAPVASLSLLQRKLGSRDGVLLVGHGTRDLVGTQQFFQLGRMLEGELATCPVQACLLELQSPTIAEGWESLRQQGIERVLVCPLLLFAAGHAKSDIPAAIAQCLSESPGMQWSQARPLSRAPELLQLVLKRFDSAYREARCSAENVATLMVGRGSFDPCAQADMKLLTHWLSGQRPTRCCRTAFYAMAKPSLPDVLRSLALLPEIEHVIVQPHLLFAGQLYQSIIQQVHTVAADFPDKRFTCAEYLGPEPEVMQAICRRLLSIAS